MAVSIDITANTSQATQAATQLSANLSAAFSGVQTQLNQMATASGQASAKMATGLQGLSQQVIRQTAVQGDLSKSFLQTGQAAQTQLNQFQKLQQQYQKTEASSKSLGSSLGGLITSVKGLAAVAGIGFSIQGIIAFGQSVVEAGIAHDRLMLSLKGALGTAQAAGEAYAFVEGVANRLGIGLLTAVEGFAKLSAATQGTVVQGQQTRDLFVAISEASRVMGLTSAETGSIVTALTQIIGKNTVSMEELRQQLGERLPSALRLTAKEMGLTTSRFIEMVSKGEILATDFIPAVTRAMQQMGKEAPAAAQSVQAALERLGNAWLTLKVTIAQSGLLELVASIAEEMAHVINLTTNWINRTKRLAGEMGLAPMREELARIDAQLMTLQEHATEVAEFGELSANQIRDLKVQRIALVEQIALKQQVFEKDEAIRKAADAVAQQDIANASAKEAEIAVLKKASAAWLTLGDDIKEVETSLKALRSFDVESLKALQVDPFAPDFEQQFNRAEAFLLKRQKELLDKRAGINKGDAARAAQEAGQSAVEVAKAREEALATSLKREETMIQQSADERRRIADEEAITALQTQGPSAVAAIDAKRSQERRQIAVDEAQFLQTLRLKALDDEEKLRAARLQAEIAAAGKNTSAAVKAQEDLNALAADTEAERVKIRAKTEDALQNVSKKSADAQIEQAKALNKIIQETEADRLQARIDLVDEQIALVEAQVEGEVLTTQEGIAKIQALEQQRFADVRLQYEQKAQKAIDAINAEVQKTAEGSDARVQAVAIAAEQIRKINEGLAHDLQAVDLQQQTSQQRHLNELLEDWRKWVKDVQNALGNFLFRWMDGQIKSIKDVLLDLKSYFFKIIADMIAYAATHAIIVPIVGAVLGGLGGGTGGVLDTIMKGFGLGNMVAGLAGAGGVGGVGGAGGTGGASDHILQILGLGKMGLELNNLLGPQGMVSGAFHVLTDTVMGGVQSVADFVNALKFGTDITTESAINLSAAMDAAIPGTPLPGAGATGAGAVTAGQIAGIAGGFAALGTAIYGALNASNNAAKAAYAASAAASAFAAGIGVYGALMGAAVVTAGGTGWTGIGLAAAAALAIAAVVLDKVIKPEGPTLAVGAPRGLNVATSDGKLQVQGDAGSRIFRTDDVDPAVARGVQAQMEAGITNAVISVIDMINAIALKPEALLGPTQEALQRTLNSIKTLNSSSAKHMEKDILEQLRFINVQVVAGMLEPVNLAFDQLRDLGTLDEQLSRLPGTVAGMVEIFKNLQKELDDIGGVQNTDVFRQLSGVRNQVENFGNRIAGTAGQIAETIVTSIIDRFKTDVDTDFASQVTLFSDLLKSTFQSLAILRNTKETLEKAGLGGGAIGSQMDRLAVAAEQAAGQIAEQIVTGILETLQQTEDNLSFESLAVTQDSLEHFDKTLAEQITDFSTLMTSSLQALGLLREVKGRLEGGGLGGGAVGGQIDRLAQATGEAAARISTQIVSTALSGLATNLNQVLIQPIRIQATTVNSLFNDSLAALNALWAQWHVLEAAGIDITGIKDEFTRLVGGVIESALTVITQAFTRGSFAEFLAVLVSIPDDVAKLNPKLAELKALGVAFAQVVGPINQAIETMEEDLRTTAERVTFTETRMSDLRDAIADAGNAADRALPLYAQLATAIQANGQAQIDSVNEVADAQIKAANEAADAQIAAVNEMADATKKAVNEWADAWTKAINDAADTQIALVNAWADDWTKAVNDAIDQQRTLLALWVEDMTNAVNTWADLANATAGQLRTVNEILLAEKSPAAQKAELLAEEGRLAAVVAGGGPGSSEAMTELIRVEQQLLALAKQSDDLKAQRDTLVKLEAMQKYLRDQLVALTGQSDPILAQIAIANTQKDHLKAIDDFNTKYGQYLTDVQAVYLDLIAKEQKLQIDAINVARDAQLQAVAVSRDFLLQAIDQLATAEITTMNNARDAQILAINTARDELVKAIKVDVINQLKALEAALKTLFAGQDVVGGTLHVPVPVRMAQQGALIGFASGGMVPAMLEPGERVYFPPVPAGVADLNRAVPRFGRGGGFTVPGSGSGDTFFARVPGESFALNKRASGAMGYQNGGPVSGRSDGGSPPVVNIHIAKMEVRNDQDIKAIISGITAQLRREWRSQNDTGPFR